MGGSGSGVMACRNAVDHRVRAVAAGICGFWDTGPVERRWLMAERPSGTVTFLFTDIEGSTRQWEADATAMRAGLASHDEVLRSAVEGRGGWLFKHTGDGVCAAFSSARDAVAAAVDAQRRLG